MSVVDRVASLAFLAFTLIEWGFEQESFIWQLRFAWMFVVITSIYAAHRREQKNAPENSGVNLTTKAEESIRPDSMSAPVEHLTSPTVLAVASSPSSVKEAVVVQAGDVSSMSVTPPPPSLIKKKSGSFVKRTASALLSPLRRSSRSPKTVGTEENASPTPELDSDSREPSDPVMQLPIVKAILDTGPASSPTLDSPRDVIDVSHTGTLMDSFGFGPEAIQPNPSFVYVPKHTWGRLGHLIETQTEVLKQFRAFNFNCTESRDENPAFVIDDEALLRFLRARKFDIEKARRMLESHLAWRDKFLPSRLTPNDISSVLGSGLARFGPYSKEGLPVTIIKVEYYDPAKFDGDVDLFTKYVAFFFERAIYRLPKGADRGILFFDMRGWSIRKHATRFSLKLIGELINIIQAHNPERLEKCILFNTPLIFSGTWSLIKILLDPVVAEKVVFVSDPAVVLEMFDKGVLPKEYGGERILPYPIEGFAELHPVNNHLVTHTSFDTETL